MLKNEHGLLPLAPKAEILVAGGGADKLNQQAGGWSLSWQGDDMPNSAFPNAHSIWTGIRDTVAAAGGHATLSPDGSFTAKPAAAIVVFASSLMPSSRATVRRSNTAPATSPTLPC